MSLFNAYVMMDWSGSDRRRSGRQDCIWIAHESAEATEPITVSPASRTEAQQIIRAVLQSVVTANKGRVLLCADFGYGYPAGFASLVSHSRSAELPPWRVVWRYLREHIRDDIGTKPGQQPNNRSNRFEVANEINVESSSFASRGPFWCLFKPGNHVCVPQNKPSQPFVFHNTSIAPLRITDKRAKSDTPFRLFGTGSVGSQVLTGIPRLENLRFDTVRSLLRGLAFRNRMGSIDWNVARSRNSNPSCRNLSERSSDARGHDQGSRPGVRDVALGARSRRNEFTHQGIRKASRHSKRINGGSDYPKRRGLDIRLLIQFWMVIQIPKVI